MGILGTIGVVILVGTHFQILEVHQGWYIFWWVVVVLNVVNMMMEDK